MAKRTNILRTLKSEIQKGNTVIMSNGNFVNERYIISDLFDDFTKDLKNGKIEMTETPESYCNKKLLECIKAEDVLKMLETMLTNGYVDTDNVTQQDGKEVIVDGTGQTDVNNGTSRKDARGRNKDSKKANA